jgi:hypothetical protein
VSYQKTDGTYVYTEPFVVASAARTTSSNSAAVEVGNRSHLRGLLLTVSAASGTTPTLDVQVQTSNDGSTGWTIVGTAFTQATGTTTQRKTFSSLDRFVRVAWTLGGTTPSFTFSLAGELV